MPDPDRNLGSVGGGLGIRVEKPRKTTAKAAAISNSTSISISNQHRHQQRQRRRRRNKNTKEKQEQPPHKTTTTTLQTHPHLQQLPQQKQQQQQQHHQQQQQEDRPQLHPAPEIYPQKQTTTPRQGLRPKPTFSARNLGSGHEADRETKSKSTKNTRWVSPGWGAFEWLKEPLKATKSISSGRPPSPIKGLGEKLKRGRERTRRLNIETPKPLAKLASAFGRPVLLSSSVELACYSP